MEDKNTSYEIKTIKDEQKEHKVIIDTHTKEIASLQIGQAKTDIQIQQLVGSIKELVSTFRTIMFAGFGALIGFLIWYIQKL